MPTPIAPHIILSHNARTDLQAVARAHSTPQTLALRARIVLRDLQKNKIPYIVEPLTGTSSQVLYPDERFL
jgi:hypothetical protein